MPAPGMGNTLKLKTARSVRGDIACGQQDDDQNDDNATGRYKQGCFFSGAFSL